MCRRIGELERVQCGYRGCLHHYAELGPGSTVVICMAGSGVNYGRSVRSGIFTMSEAAWRISSMGGGVRGRIPLSRAYKSYEAWGVAEVRTEQSVPLECVLIGK
jgi:hypothetical protein